MFSFGSQSQVGKCMNLPADSIQPNPNQPRRIFDEGALTALSLSIARHGVIQPLIVRRVAGGYELVAGERRLRAAKMAGIKSVPCVIAKADGEQSSILALIENLQRRDLDFFEEAQGYRQLIDNYAMTQESIAEQVGRSQSAVANKLRLLRLSRVCVEKIRSGGLSERHARALLKLDESRWEDTLDVIINGGLNVAKTEEYIDRILAEGPIRLPPRQQPRPIIKDIRFFFNSVDRAVDMINQAGVGASCEREENEGGYKITIMVPKKA